MNGALQKECLDNKLPRIVVEFVGGFYFYLTSRNVHVVKRMHTCCELKNGNVVVYFGENEFSIRHAQTMSIIHHTIYKSSGPRTDRLAQQVRSNSIASILELPSGEILTFGYDQRHFVFKLWSAELVYIKESKPLFGKCGSSLHVITNGVLFQIGDTIRCLKLPDLVVYETFIIYGKEISNFYVVSDNIIVVICLKEWHVFVGFCNLHSSYKHPDTFPIEYFQCIDDLFRYTVHTLEKFNVQTKQFERIASLPQQHRGVDFQFLSPKHVIQLPDKRLCVKIDGSRLFLLDEITKKWRFILEVHRGWYTDEIHVMKHTGNLIVAL